MTDTTFASHSNIPVRARSARAKTSTLQRVWNDASPLTRKLAFVASLLAIGLLATFYSVVSHAVGRAQAGRENARVSAERHVVCSAFSAGSSRDLCLLTIAAHAERAAGRPLARVSTEEPVWQGIRPVVSARAY